MFEHRGKNAKVKLIDFGFAEQWDGRNPMTKRCGTLGYVAPEVLSGSYTKAADMFSFGAVVYVMLMGRDLYVGDEATVLAKTKLGAIDLCADFYTLSSGARDFICGCLNFTPELRPSASSALRHSWLTQFLEPAPSLSQGPVPQRVSEEVTQRLTTTTRTPALLTSATIAPNAFPSVTTQLSVPSASSPTRPPLEHAAQSTSRISVASCTKIREGVVDFKRPDRRSWLTQVAEPAPLFSQGSFSKAVAEESPQLLPTTSPTPALLHSAIIAPTAPSGVTTQLSLPLALRPIRPPSDYAAETSSRIFVESCPRTFEGTGGVKRSALRSWVDSIRGTIPQRLLTTTRTPALLPSAIIAPAAPSGVTTKLTLPVVPRTAKKTLGISVASPTIRKEIGMIKPRGCDGACCRVEARGFKQLYKRSAQALSDSFRNGVAASLGSHSDVLKQLTCPGKEHWRTARDVLTVLLSNRTCTL